MRTARHAVFAVLTFLILAAVAIATALWVTPMQSVSVAGQTVRVGATAPSLSLSGPGELDLFGQRLDTVVTFAGPVRPRLQLTRITPMQDLTALLQPQKHAEAAKALRQALVSGWRRYVMWEAAVVALTALLLGGAIAGWQRRSLSSTLAFLLIGLVLAEGVNAGAVMFAAATVSHKLQEIDSLQALVGTAAPPTAPITNPPPPSGGLVVVIGDSTAAGLGNPPLPQPGPDDSTCRRSIDAFAQFLDNATDRQVTNLACSGATIRAGLLGPQRAGSVTVPPQLSTAAASGASSIVISIGANDVHWSEILRVCAATPNCQNAAEQAYFDQQIGRFTADYLGLLRQLKALPRQPRVVINLYYNPFGDSTACLASIGIDDAKRQALTQRLDTLNTLLAQGAQAASFAVARPDFSSHGLCSRQPFVQGIHDPAPFHPTAAGELAIALADQQALMHVGPK